MNKKGASFDPTIVLIVLIGLVVVLALGALIQKNTNIFSITGSETLSQTVPVSVQAGQPFNITYQASGVSGNWGVIIDENLTGGCTYNGLNEIRLVMLSPSQTQTIFINSPSTAGTCTISGLYEFGTSPIQNLNSQVNIVSIPTPTSNQTSTSSGNPTQTASGNPPSSDFFSTPLFGTTWLTGTILLVIIGGLILLLLLMGRKK